MREITVNPADKGVLLNLKFKMVCERPPSRRRRQGVAHTQSGIGVGQQAPSAVATFFRRSAAVALCLFVAVPFLHAQAPLDPEKLVDQWFIRLNALDDWYISYDGKEETDAVVDRFVELYDRDAFHQVGPNENQIGPVVFHGPDGIKKWATDFAKKHVQLAYRVDMITRNEKTGQLMYSVKPPWGGIAAAVEFTAVYTNREDRKRIMIPGSAFFVFDDSGKILRLRLYMLRDETAEIEQ